MKLAVDLFPCQTESRFRGIGRYSHSLVLAMARLRQKHDMVILANSLLPDSFEELRQEFIRELPFGSFKPYDQGIPGGAIRYSSAESIIAETLVRRSYQAVGADVTLSPSIFEGLGGIGVVPLPDGYNLGSRVAILYDIIPFLFQAEYLDQNPVTKEWYLDRLHKIHTYDLLLAISEATRQDAIDHLGIAPEKIVNISGAASSNFKQIPFTDTERFQVLHKYGIIRPFVLYLGGNNPRKNMMGLVRAYAQLPREILHQHQLVINEVEHEAVFYSRIKSMGLDPEDVVITGRIPEEDLVVLYNTCKLFVFPSLYEGFGLPVLEAMSCGAAVIAANNSSLPEVVGRPDALFNASESSAITEALQRVLPDDGLLSDLRDFGLKRSREFSWKKSAQTTWLALEALNEKMHVSKIIAIQQPANRTKPVIAFVTPLPPQQSGIASYSAELLPYLEKHFEIDLFVEPGLEVSDKYLQQHFQIFPYTQLLQRKDRYRTVVYQVGNSEFHNHMVQLMREFPGVVVQHDFFLPNLPLIAEFYQNQPGEFFRQMDASHGLRGIVEYRKFGLDQAVQNWPINWEIIKYASQLVVHSNYYFKLFNKFYQSGWKPTLTVINHLRATFPEKTEDEKSYIKTSLGLPDKSLLICSFGMISPTKLHYEILQAFDKMCLSVDLNVRLIIVGEFHEDSVYGKKIKKLILDYNLEPKVIITGYIDRPTYEQYLAIADIAVQLRTATRGETSGAVLDCLANGIPTIINSHGTFDDYDSEYVRKLPEVVDVETLAEAFIQLSSQPILRAKLGKNARNAIYEHHRPERIAQEYARVIQIAIEGDERLLFAPLVKSLRSSNAQESLVKSLSVSAAKSFGLRSQVRILLELSAYDDMEPGIQKVLADLIKDWFSPDDRLLQLELVGVVEKTVCRATELAEKLFDLPQGSLGDRCPIKPQGTDILLLTDPYCSIDNEWMNAIKQNGGKVALLAFDNALDARVPSEHLSGTTSSGKKLPEIIDRCDLVVCVSSSLADTIAQKVKEEGHRSTILDLSVFPEQPRIDSGDSTGGAFAVEMQDVLLGKYVYKRI